MKLIIDKRDYKLWIGIKGIEPIWRTYHRNNEQSTSDYTHELFYPVRYWRHRIWTKILWNYLKYIKKSNPKMCEMCGTSIATTFMKDPNYDSDKVLMVCNYCPTWIVECIIDIYKETQNRKFGVIP